MKVATWSGTQFSVKGLHCKSVHSTPHRNTFRAVPCVKLGSTRLHISARNRLVTIRSSQDPEAPVSTEGASSEAKPSTDDQTTDKKKGFFLWRWFFGEGHEAEEGAEEKGSESGTAEGSSRPC